MALFSLFALMDTADRYNAAMKRLMRMRKDMLYRGFGVTPPQDPESADYYQLIDVEGFVRSRYGDDFLQWLLARLQPNEALFRMAEEAGVVVLPAAGFGASHPSFRVSLANLTEVEYDKIGTAILKIGEEYFAEYQAAVGEKGAAAAKPSRR